MNANFSVDQKKGDYTSWIEKDCKDVENLSIFYLKKMQYEIGKVTLK